MLRKLLIIGIVTLTVNDVFAQIDYGVKAGLNHVNVVRTDLTTNFRKYKQSFHLGGYVNLDLGDKLITQVELLYSNKGYKNGANSVNEIGHTNLNYINLPVLLRYQVFNKVSFNFGPEFGYLISAFGRNGDIKQSQNEFWDNKLDLGAIVGLSINVVPKLTLDFRYTHGFRSVAKNFVPPPGFGTEGRLIYLNRALQLSVLFSLKK